MPIISYSYTHSILYILYTHTCAHTRFLKHSHRGKWLTLQFASDCAISFMSVQLARDWASQHTQTETHYYPHAQLIESHAVLRLCARDKYSARISESAREKCVCSTVCAFFLRVTSLGTTAEGIFKPRISTSNVKARSALNSQCSTSFPLTSQFSGHALDMHTCTLNISLAQCSLH